MSKFEDFNVHSIVHEILMKVPLNDEHGGRRFLSIYQISIQFRHYPYEFEGIEKPIYQKHHHVSLPSYLAAVLARGIKCGTIKDIEIAFLDTSDMIPIEFKLDGETFPASTQNASKSLTLFRAI